MSLIKSESIGKLISALVLAKAAFSPVLKLNENPGFKRNGQASKYADLATAIAATEPALLANGLVVNQFPVNDAERVGSLTLLTHSSGEYLGESFTLPLGQQNAQTGVAAVTYARRTGYLAALGIASEDDDGQTASGRDDDTRLYQQTDDLPDFHQESRHAAFRPAPAPKTGTEAPKTKPPTELPMASPAPQAGASAPVAAGNLATASGVPAAVTQSQTEGAKDVAPEHGDAYEGPDPVDGGLPTEAELTEYRQKFKKLGDDLSADGGLKPSKGLPLNRKLLVFLISVTKAPDAKTLTKAQWDNFFDRADKARASDTGLVGIAKLVNKANGIEDPKKN